MARKPIVDRDTVLQMLRDGQTTQRVADFFGVSRQAVDLHRKDFIARGLITDRRAIRSRASVLAPTREGTPAQMITPEAPSMPSPSELAALPLDQIIDIAIQAFAALKKLPEVEAELDRYRQSYQTAAAEIERLRKAEERRRDQEQRWFLAQK